MEYPFDKITLNGRDVPLEAICNNSVVAHDAFESATFAFIRTWFSSEHTFTLHTSGSTGTPKPIQLHRDQMMASARATIQALGLARGDHALVCLDTRYIAGQMMLVRSFVGGFYIEAVTPCANPLQHVSNRRIAFTALVPYQVHAILSSDQAERLNQTGSIIIGGAALDQDTISALQRYGCAAYATYGMTETVSHIALQRLNGPEKSDHFHTLPNIVVETDSRLCLVIQCPFLPQPVVTNDIVEILNPTSFRWLGRADNIINTGGVKISPEQVEKRLKGVLSSLNLHCRFIVCGAYDIVLGNRVTLVLESQPLESEVITSILGMARSVVNPYEAPRAVETLAVFPETATGKIDRRKIAELIDNRA